MSGFGDPRGDLNDTYLVNFCKIGATAAGGMVGGVATAAGVGALAGFPPVFVLGALGLAAGLILCPRLPGMLKQKFQSDQTFSDAELHDMLRVIQAETGVRSSHDAMTLLAAARIAQAERMSTPVKPAAPASMAQAAQQVLSSGVRIG